MATPGDWTYAEQVRALVEWRQDASRELRDLEGRVKRMETAVERNSRVVDKFARKEEIADAVAERLEGMSARRLRWWPILLGVVALLPPYVAMVVLLARL